MAEWEAGLGKGVRPRRRLSCVLWTRLKQQLRLPAESSSPLDPQVQQLLSATQLAGARAAGTGFSGLAVTVLRRVLRVAASAKMAPDAKTAVAGYVAGAPWPLQC